MVNNMNILISCQVKRGVGEISEKGKEVKEEQVVVNNMNILESTPGGGGVCSFRKIT